MTLQPFVVAPGTLMGSGLQVLTLSAYALAQALLLMYAAHRWSVLWRQRRANRCVVRPPAVLDPPLVTVQIPLFNERHVAERLIDAAAALEYPRERLEIQVLDDSTDDTRGRLERAVARHAARGVPIRLLHRARRTGFKAGALSEGLVLARGELVAVFDADFVPPTDFLVRLVPHFAAADVGMVQARWGHLNREASWLTRAQAVLLDAHFVLEHAVRMRHRLFFNFNGTAGIWRRRCIEQAGGWSSDTLTEDLDLSYRAQLSGWRFVFDGSIEAPAELPEDVEAFKSQQRRWAKGSIQTARKLLGRVLRAPLPAAVKLEACFHLTSNVAYPLLLILGLLLLPVLIASAGVPARWALGLQVAVIAFGAIPVGVFLAAGQRALGRTAVQTARDVSAALVLCAGLSLNNARAVFEGLGGGAGDWERTPKTGRSGAASGVRPTAGGAADAQRYPSARRITGRSELALAAYFIAVALLTALAGHARATPFALLLVAGFTSVGVASLRSSLAQLRAQLL